MTSGLRAGQQCMSTIPAPGQTGLRSCSVNAAIPVSDMENASDKQVQDCPDE